MTITFINTNYIINQVLLNNTSILPYNAQTQCAKSSLDIETRYLYTNLASSLYYFIFRSSYIK